MGLTEDERIQSTPRASKDPNSFEYARQMVYVLRICWERSQFVLADWDKELQKARQYEIWKQHKPSYSSLEELLAKEVGYSDGELKERKAKDRIHQLRKEHPDWTQQRIADEVGVTQQYVARVTTDLSDSDNLVVTPPVKSRTDQAAFRKLPEAMQEKVVSGEVSLNAAAIEAGIRKKPSPDEKTVAAWRKCENRLNVLRHIVLDLTDSEVLVVAEWLAEERIDP